MLFSLVYDPAGPLASKPHYVERKAFLDELLRTHRNNPDAMVIGARVAKQFDGELYTGRVRVIRTPAEHGQHGQGTYMVRSTV